MAKNLQTFKGETLYTPLHPSAFAHEFFLAGTTILSHVRYALHARQILVNERNFFGLLALDTILQNRHRKYRKDDITPSVNHPLLLFYQLHMAHMSDQMEETDYLFDRPDLDKVAVLFHDEGEDIQNFSKEALERKLLNFIENISVYIAEHNKRYPFCSVPLPTKDKIEQMRRDIPDIVEPFDLMTKGYKGGPKTDYFAYHQRILGDQDLEERQQSWHARACRVKATDKACNGATFAYRSKKMLTTSKFEHAKNTYRIWINRQIGKMRDIYFDQNFLGEENGFMNAGILKFPQSKSYLTLMKKVMEMQLRIYTHDSANERPGHKSPFPDAAIPEYDKICFSPRIHLVNILTTRLREVVRLDEEVVRLDELGEKGPRHTGMFGIPFKGANSNNPDLERTMEHIISNNSIGYTTVPPAFYSFAAPSQSL